MFIRGSLTEACWSAALLLQPVEYSEGSSAVIKLQRESDRGPALPPLVFCPISGSWIVTSSFHTARKLPLLTPPVRWLKAWLPHVKNAAQVAGTYPSSQHFAKVIAIFWSDKKDYSIFDKENVSILRDIFLPGLWFLYSSYRGLRSTLIDLGRVTFLVLSNWGKSFWLAWGYVETGGSVSIA